MVAKTESNKKIDFDNDIIVCSVAQDLTNANFLWYLPNVKKRYNVAVIPAWHFLYTWRLKSAWYKWLDFEKKKTLSMVFLWWNITWISIYSNDIIFMWKRRNTDVKLIQKYCKNIKFFDELPEKIQYELPYPRILNDYDSVYIFEIWEKTSKKVVEEFLLHLSKIWNIVMFSDLHSWLSVSECENLDEETLNWKKDLKVFDRFFSLAEMSKKKPKFIWYSNSADLDWKTSSTTWYCTMAF